MCSLVPRPRAMCSLVPRPRAMCSLVPRPRAMCSLVPRPRAMCSLVPRPRAMCSLVPRPRAMCSLVPRPRAMCSLVPRPRAMCSLVPRPRAMCSLVPRPRAMCSLVPRPRAMCSLVPRPRAMCSLVPRPRAMCDCFWCTCTAVHIQRMCYGSRTVPGVSVKTAPSLPLEMKNMTSALAPSSLSSVSRTAMNSRRSVGSSTENTRGVLRKTGASSLRSNRRTITVTVPCGSVECVEVGECNVGVWSVWRWGNVMWECGVCGGGGM